MSLTSLGDALKQRMKQDLPLQRQVETGSLLTLAFTIIGEFVGEQNLKEVKPLFIKNRTFTVTCTNSALCQEIHLNQAKIVQEINTRFGQNVLDRIRYLL